MHRKTPRPADNNPYPARIALWVRMPIWALSRIRGMRWLTMTISLYRHLCSLFVVLFQRAGYRSGARVIYPQGINMAKYLQETSQLRFCDTFSLSPPVLPFLLVHSALASDRARRNGNLRRLSHSLSHSIVCRTKTWHLPLVLPLAVCLWMPIF